MSNQTTACILCNNKLSKDQTNQYHALKHFEKYCICNSCLEKTRKGWE